MTDLAADAPVEAEAPPPAPALPRPARIGIIPALTVFLSAFLLFQVQPLIGKYILPWFGGAPGVWTTCLLFFQVALLAGYAYAHLVVSRVSPKTQAIVHAALLLAAVATLPIIPAERWKPPDPYNPAGRIAMLLALCVGLPYFALATTAPLLQAWVARTDPRVAPYRLYALSNFASLLALVSYPFLIEPLLGRRQQAWAWSGLFVLFAAGCAYCAFRASRAKNASPPWGEGGGEGAERTPPPDSQDETRSAALADLPDVTRSAAGPSPLPSPQGGEGVQSDVLSRARPILWLVLPACATALLMGTTNTLTQDVAPVPFLWVLPLALYLLTFVLAFDHPRWYSRRICGPLMIIAAAALGWAMNQSLHDISLWQMLLIYGGGLFIACLMCHGELARLRPHPSRLTAYYLAISAGGALGGIFVSVAAPLLFTRYLEFGIALWACCALLLFIAGNDPRSWLVGLRPPVAWVALSLGMIVLAVVVWSVDVHWPGAVLIDRSRNFYGVLRVHEWAPEPGAPPRYRSLHHGRVMHGLQMLAPGARRSPATYYGAESGIGQAMAALDANSPRHVGVIGLGVGSLAALAKPGHRMRFYEIDPDVLRVARTHFTYLQDSPAAPAVDVVLGDARLSLEREPPQAFDLLVVDAFSGDAIPVHLLTREAFAIYRRHVKPDGTIVVHITNRHLNLRPVVAGAARELGMTMTVVAHNPTKEQATQTPSRWAILKPSSRRPATGPSDGEELIWTDDSANLLSVIRRSRTKSSQDPKLAEPSQ